MAREYKKIIAWQRAHELTKRIYQETRSFPKDEMFGMTSQIRRAAYSVPSNIVEGSARESKKDYLRFLHIAFASLKEVEYFILLSYDLGYLDAAVYDELSTAVNETFAPFSGLIKAVKREVGVSKNAIALLLSILSIGAVRWVTRS
jgi:four helix bundle protein